MIHTGTSITILAPLALLFFSTSLYSTTGMVLRCRTFLKQRLPQRANSASFQLVSATSMSALNGEMDAARDPRQQLSSPEQPEPPPQKFHHITVCMVPPESSERVWEYVTQCRTDLRDPGLFRWPPHANLLYPFLKRRTRTTTTNNDHTTENDGGDNDTVDPDILDGLVRACQQCDPFTVRLQQLGVFGGKKRGVLWLYPDSRITSGKQQDDDDDPAVVEPLVRLQSLLVESFPTCNDQNLKSSTEEGFNPHMTLSHFVNLDEAEAARRRLQPDWPTDLEFCVDTIYLMERTGDAGQFVRVADISLGANAAAIVHDGLPFRHMPATEADWVREERMKLKQRRRRNGRGRRRRRESSSSPRVLDSPEVIAAKRAARKAKREQQAAEAEQSEA